MNAMLRMNNDETVMYWRVIR